MSVRSGPSDQDPPINPDTARAARRERRGSPTDALRRLVRAPSTVLALLVLGTLAGAALAAPIVSPYDPLEQNMGDFLVRPGLGHWCGTDQFGRDILSRIIWGGRLTLQVGLISVGIAALAGVTLGLAAGFYGSWPDLVIMRLIDLLLAFPSILLALGVVAVLGGSLPNVMIAVGIAGVPQFTRVVRAAVLGARALPYVEAAHAVGAREGLIMWRHVLPNVLAPALVLGTTSAAAAIITGAALSFLGLGVRPPAPEWGAMLSTGREYLRHAPWMSIFPGLAIMLAVVSINVVGDRLRDVLDPRLHLE
jgi:peptide/nickel transport system permease protein